MVNRREYDPRNIGKCWICDTHLIIEEVLEHLKKHHHSEYIKILKKNGL